MTINLEYIALRWLAYERACVAVLHERTPKNCAGQPDVIGVTKARYVIEIEIKRTLSDFKADFKKHHRANREFYLKQQPKQFYYFVPSEIFEKVKPILPPWAGLARCDKDFVFKVEVEAPINNESARLTTKECVKLARCMTNQIVSFSTEINRWKNNFMAGHWEEMQFESRYEGEPIWSYTI